VVQVPLGEIFTILPFCVEVMYNSDMRKYNSGRARPLQSGQAVIVPVTLLILIALSLVARGTQPVKTESQLARGLTTSKQASALADAGSEDVSYRIKRVKEYSTTEYVPLDGLISTTTVVTDPLSNVKQVLSQGIIDGRLRQKKINLTKGDNAEFNYAAQIGEGGLKMHNNSTVDGRVFSNGPITTANEVPGAMGYVTGTAIAAGPYSPGSPGSLAQGKVERINATGDIYAYSILSSVASGGCYFQIIMGTLCGTLHPNSPEIATTAMPISDELIAQWEAIASTAVSDQCVGGKYTITGTTVTLGPIRIPCDLEIKGGGGGTMVILSGMVWVQGKVSISQSPVIRLHEDLGSNSIAIIADKTGVGVITDRHTSSTFEVANSTTFTNSGTPGSFIFLISGNTAAEDDWLTCSGPCSIIAGINIANSANGEVVLYANHGLIKITSSGTLRSVTGWAVDIAANADLVYTDGLANTIFNTGPGGSWDVQSWRETQ